VLELNEGSVSPTPLQCLPLLDPEVSFLLKLLQVSPLQKLDLIKVTGAMQWCDGMEMETKGEQLTECKKKWLSVGTHPFWPAPFHARILYPLSL